MRLYAHQIIKSNGMPSDIIESFTDGILSIQEGKEYNERRPKEADFTNFLTKRAIKQCRDAKNRIVNLMKNSHTPAIYYSTLKRMEALLKHATNAGVNEWRTESPIWNQPQT